MKKKVLILSILVVAISVSLLQAAPLTLKPGSADKYAESVYAEYTAGAGGKVLFEVETLETGKLADIAGARFGDLIETPAYRVESSQFGLEIRNPHFFTPKSVAYAADDLEYTVEGFEEVGYPIDMGVYRKLQVGVAIGSTIREHQALEFSWPELGHSVVLDPAVVFLDSTVRNRVRLAAEGWGPRIQVDRLERGSYHQKATCQLSAYPGYVAVHFTWGSWWWESKNIFGMTLVRKDLAGQQAGVRCLPSSGCKTSPYGYSWASSCSGNLGWTCQCDNEAGWGNNGAQTTGKFVAETKCTHEWFNQAKASGSVTGQGSLSVDIAWTLGGGVHSNGGETIQSCAVY